MPEGKHIFVSDAHLRNIRDNNQKLLVSFFDSIKGKAKALYILGDLFDFWYGYRSVVYTQFVPVLAKLIELKESGTDLIMIEGNHEFRFDIFFRDEIGAEVKDVYIEKEIEGTNFFLTHGDNMNTMDRGHKLLNFFFKNRLSYLAVNTTHPGFWWRMANYLSSMSRQNLTDHISSIKDACRDFAKQKFEKGFDAVVIGHTHEAGMEKTEINGKEKTLIFLGDWIENFYYLEFDGRDFKLKQYEQD